MTKKKTPDLNCNSNTGINQKTKFQNSENFSLIPTQNQGKRWFCRKDDFSHGRIILGKNIICFICFKEFIDGGGNLRNLLEAIKRGDLCLN